MKHRKHRIPSILGLAAIGILPFGSAHAATTYTVNGFSFEAPVPAGAFSYGFPTGWSGSNSGLVGVQKASATNGGLLGATGAQVAFVNGNNSIWSAASLTTITLGETYTLTVDVLSRTDFASSGFQIRFFNPGGLTQLATSGVIDPVDDKTMHTYTLNWTATAGQVGNGLIVMLSNNSGSNQTSFDNVRVTSVPEPSAALLGGLGMLALLRRRRSR